MRKKDMIDRIVLETADCTNWSHRELVERVIWLAECSGMQAPKPANVKKLYKAEPDGIISEYKSKWGD